MFSRVYFFFFNDTATTEIYTLSLHDALPISGHEIYNPSTAGRGRLASLEEDARREAVSVNCSQRRQFAKIQKLASQFWELGSFPGLPSIVTGKPEVTPEDRNSRHYFR